MVVRGQREGTLAALGTTWTVCSIEICAFEALESTKEDDTKVCVYAVTRHCAVGNDEDRAFVGARPATLSARFD